MLISVEAEIAKNLHTEGLVKSLMTLPVEDGACINEVAFAVLPR